MAKRKKGRNTRPPAKAPPKRATGRDQVTRDNDAVPEPATDIPKTRQHTQPPPERASALHLDATGDRVRVVALDPQITSSLLIAGWLILSLGVPLARADSIDGSVFFNLLWRSMIVPILYLVIRQLVPAVKAYRLRLAFTEMPNDGQLARGVRMFDEILGKVEQAILVALLVAVVLCAAAAGVMDKIVHNPLGRWWFTVVRGGTFAIAIFGAVFATHQQRHLAMDLISRSLPPRGRLVLGIILKLFVIGVLYLLWTSGWHQRDTVGETSESFISDKTVVTTLPIGAALIMLHSLLHLIIDAEYLARGKLPVERMRSGH